MIKFPQKSRIVLFAALLIFLTFALLASQNRRSQQRPERIGRVESQGRSDDVEEAKRLFLEGRDHPPKPGKLSEFDTVCHRTCRLSARCYSARHSVWHPERCRPVEAFSSTDFGAGTTCANISIVFMGDSRVRALFGATLRSIYPKDTKVHRIKHDGEPQTISVKNVTSSNYLMAQKLGGLQMDMWTMRDQGLFGEKQNNPQVKRMSFLWEPYLTRSHDALRKDFAQMRPEAVVLEAGLWFVWKRLNQFDKYQLNLDSMIKTLKRIREKMDFHFDIVIMLNEQPLGFDNDYKVKQKDVDRLNDLARKVAASHGKSVIVWDAHLALQDEYAQICARHHIPTDEDFNWRCDDDIHSGFVVYQHLSQALLNHICTPP